MAVTGSARTVLVVEDDAGVRHLLELCLVAEGYDVRHATDGFAALATLAETPVDLVLLDLTLPGVAGMDVLARVRRTSLVPVIVVSGQAEYGERVRALRTGADDFISKPFELDELVARVEAVLRRSQPASTPAIKAPLRFDVLEIDVDGRVVRIEGRSVELTAREFDLLAYLASTPGRVFSRDELLEAVWESRSDWQDPSTVTEHVRRLRRKVESDPERPRYVRTARGAGYVFQG